MEKWSGAFHCEALVFFKPYYHSKDCQKVFEKNNFNLHKVTLHKPASLDEVWLIFIKKYLKKK